MGGGSQTSEQAAETIVAVLDSQPGVVAKVVKITKSTSDGTSTTASNVLNDISNATGTYAVLSDVATAGEASTLELLPVAAVQLTSSIAANYISAATGCAAAVVSRTSVESKAFNCIVQGATIYLTSGVFSSAALNKLAEAASDAKQVVSDIKKFLWQYLSGAHDCWFENNCDWFWFFLCQRSKCP